MTLTPDQWRQRVDYITPFHNRAGERILRREFVRERDIMRDHDEAQEAQTWFVGQAHVALWLNRREFERLAESLADVTEQARQSAHRSAEKAAE